MVLLVIYTVRFCTNSQQISCNIFLLFIHITSCKTSNLKYSARKKCIDLGTNTNSYRQVL
jgi:hypothetical protein